MSKAIRSKAKEYLDFGMPKQAVFDAVVLEHPEARPKKVAETLRYMPTLQVRERYGRVHAWLLSVIALNAVLRIAHPMLDPGYDWAKGLQYVSLVPIATLLVGWSIYRWQGQVLMWVGWGNVASIGTFVKHSHVFARGEADSWFIIFTVLPVLIGVLALVLVYVAFPGYKVEKDALGGPERIVFPVEGGR